MALLWYRRSPWKEMLSHSTAACVAVILCLLVKRCTGVTVPVEATSAPAPSGSPATEPPMSGLAATRIAEAPAPASATAVSVAAPPPSAVASALAERKRVLPAFTASAPYTPRPASRDRDLRRTQNRLLRGNGEARHAPRGPVASGPPDQGRLARHPPLFRVGRRVGLRERGIGIWSPCLLSRSLATRARER